MLLNRNFEKIENNTVTRGELFWNRGFKYYFADEKEWEANSSGERKRVKSVAYPVARPETKFRSKSTYWPVTLPRSFRRSLTRLKILRNHIFVCKYVIKTCDLLIILLFTLLHKNFLIKSIV